MSEPRVLLPGPVVNCLMAVAKAKNKLPKELVRSDLNAYLISLVEQNLQQAFSGDKTLGDLTRVATKAPSRAYGVSKEEVAYELKATQTLAVIWQASAPVDLVVEAPMAAAESLESFEMVLSLSEILPIGWGITLPELVARRQAEPGKALHELLPEDQSHFINIAMHALAEADGTVVEEIPAGVDMSAFTPPEPETSPDSCVEEWQLYHVLQASMAPVAREGRVPVVQAETVTAGIRGVQMTYAETGIIYAEVLYKLEMYLQALVAEANYKQAGAWRMKEE